MPQPQGAPQQSAAQLNRSQRAMLLASAVDRVQQIYSGAINLSNQTVLNIPPRNAGLLKRFIIKITGTANNTDGANAATLSDFGLANLLTQVQFNDLQNNTRVQTSGIHLALLASVKQKFVGGGALLNSALNGFGVMGNNYGVITAPATIAHGASANFCMYFELPAAYSDEDLRGAVYMNVVNAAANVQLTFNAAPFVAAGVDSTPAVYFGAAGNVSNVVVTVFQEFLDQIPTGKNGLPILPALDLSTVYELKSTPFSGMVAGYDFPIPYANFRDFISTFMVYNHDGSANSGRVAGTDITSLSLQSANFTNIWQFDPITSAYYTRKILETDLPLGAYYFSSRKKPLSTISYGNMQLILNASTAAAQAYALVYWEDFALMNNLANAGSLAG